MSPPWSCVGHLGMPLNSGHGPHTRTPPHAAASAHRSRFAGAVGAHHAPLSSSPHTTAQPTLIQKSVFCFPSPGSSFPGLPGTSDQASGVEIGPLITFNEQHGRVTRFGAERPSPRTDFSFRLQKTEVLDLLILAPKPFTRAFDLNMPTFTFNF